jgi:hypothetical protein
MNQKIERLLQKKIFPDLERGKRDFDLPHTKAVVMWLQDIIRNNPQLELDRDVLIISAYAHDWGYSGLFEKRDHTNYGAVMETKPLHMIAGAEKIKILLNDELFSFLSKNQKQRIIHLVAVHDKVRDLKDLDELILMEADTLGAIDCINLKPTFDQESNKKYMNFVLRERKPKLITDFTKNKFNELAKLRQKYYDNIKPAL